MSMRFSSQGQEHVDRVNALRESEKRLAMWAALSESLAMLLERSSHKLTPGDWMYGAPVEVFHLLTERLQAIPAPGEEPFGEGMGERIAAGANRIGRNSSGAFLDEEVAATTERGAKLAARAKRALPIVAAYARVFTADNGDELRHDEDATWRAIEAWRAADSSARGMQPASDVSGEDAAS